MDLAVQMELGAPHLARFLRDVGYHEPNPQTLDDPLPAYLGR